MGLKSSLPDSWSALTWSELISVWDVKQRYAANPDVARAAALLALLGCEVSQGRFLKTDMHSGEPVYLLREHNAQQVTVTPRQLSWMAKKALPWLDYPYGDPGEKEVRNEKNIIVKERREPVRGYVSKVMNDAMVLPKETLTVGRRHFMLPQPACSNITWQQYRTLQTISPQLFREGVSLEEALGLQAQFLAHILTPRSLALLDTTGGSIRFRLHYEYKYNFERADKLAGWLMKRDIGTLFHICFQVYQTALSYYAATYPLLFGDSGSSDTVKDVLAGEVGTINAVMKYAGYTDQQQVYDANLPFVLDTLNSMSREAKEVEKMNQKIKK